jgi:MFS transporter, DHA1 family, multidrug resistance protein
VSSSSTALKGKAGAIRPGLPPLPLLIAIGALTPFSLHVIAPSVPHLARSFGQAFVTAQLTLSLYLATAALAQIGYGPISDFCGRRRTLIVGLSIYSVASIACALSRSIEALIVARVFEALGACAGLVLSRAIISDSFARDRAASVLGFKSAIMTVASAAAPVIGAYLDQALDWRAIFVVLAAYGAAATLFALKYAHETLDTRRSADFGGFLRDCRRVLSATRYVAYAGHLAAATAAWFAFVASMPQYMESTLGQPARTYGLYVTLNFAAYIAGNIAAYRLTPRRGSSRMLAWGTAISFAGFLALAATPAIGRTQTLYLFIAMSVAIAGQGITVPNVVAAALAINPRIKGTAASVLGAIQMAASAGATLLVGCTQDGTLYPILCVVAGAGLLSALALALLGIADMQRPRWRWRGSAQSLGGRW